MTTKPIRLKHLLRERHWQVYRTFCAEYDKAARIVDPELVGTWPSRAQLHRWLSGELKGLPYPGHCRVLETMFPGWSAQQLFEPVSASHQTVASSHIGQLFETIDSGLENPTAASNIAWGEGFRSTSVLPGHLAKLGGDNTDATQAIGRRLLALSKVLRLSTEETRQIAGLAGHVVELSLTVDIDIAEDGWARVSYRHELFNMTTRPFSRLPRELWFENTDGPLRISPNNTGNRPIEIHRVHDAKSLVKFACLVEPAVDPGESVVISYSCEGGQFVSDHYWRQMLARYTRHLTVTVRHRKAGQLRSCTTVIEHPDGAETAAPESVTWDTDDADALMTLTADYLQPNQAATIRWETSRGSA